MFGDEQGDPDPPTNVGLFPSSPGKGKPGQYFAKNLCEQAKTDAGCRDLWPAFADLLSGRLTLEARDCSSSFRMSDVMSNPRNGFCSTNRVPPKRPNLFSELTLSPAIHT